MTATKKDHLALDQYARLELGFRIRSTQASYRELEKLLPDAEKVEWARSAAFKSGAKMFPIPAELDEDQRVWIPDNIIDAFTKHGGFMMVKLVTSLPADHYATLAMYHKLWDFDRVQPQRENGDWVYSMPIHGLEKAGEGRKFFFVIRLDAANGRDGERAALTVNRVDITRGREHFTYGPTRTYGPFPPTTPENIPAVARQWEVQQGRESFKPLRDLPLEEAVAEYLARRK